MHPSDEALAAYSSYLRNDPNICYYFPFVKEFIYFLIDDFNLEIDLSSLPCDPTKETPTEEQIRITVLNRLTKEFKDKFEDPYSQSSFVEEDEFEHNAERVLLEVSYFCLNRKPRQPSDLDRPHEIRTADDMRRERWGQMIDEQYKQGQRKIIQVIEKIDVGESLSDLRNRLPSYEKSEKRDCNNLLLNGVRVSAQNDLKVQKKVYLDTTSTSDPQAEMPHREPECRPINRQVVLEYLICKVRQLHGNRYGEILEKMEDKELCEVLERNLAEPVREISDRGLFTLDGLKSIGGNAQSSGPGIYMHIIWDLDNGKRFWLYIGQATSLQRRISDHNDKLYRWRHPSLHYYVWDAMNKTGSEFVILSEAEFQSQDHNFSRFDQCLLNMQEMWMACLFQTLTTKDLDRYLSPAVRRQSFGQHLNVVPPIWQRFQNEILPHVSEIHDRLKFHEYLQSKNSNVREWAKSSRDSYNDLRNSPDPELRKYWFETNRRQLQQAWEMNNQNARDSLKIYQTDGKEETVKCAADRNRGYITCGKFFISIPQALDIPIGRKVYVRFHLYDCPFQLRYAQKALPNDPSSRLGISIRGQNSRGHEIQSWLQSRTGKKLVMRMNNLVDALEGICYSETCLLRRRWIVAHLGEHSERQTRYTN